MVNPRGEAKVFSGRLGTAPRTVLKLQHVYYITSGLPDGKIYSLSTRAVCLISPEMSEPEQPREISPVA